MIGLLIATVGYSQKSFKYLPIQQDTALISCVMVKSYEKAQMTVPLNINNTQEKVVKGVITGGFVAFAGIVTANHFSGAEGGQEMNTGAYWLMMAGLATGYVVIMITY